MFVIFANVEYSVARIGAEMKCLPHIIFEDLFYDGLRKVPKYFQGSVNDTPQSYANKPL